LLAGLLWSSQGKRELSVARLDEIDSYSSWLKNTKRPSRGGDKSYWRKEMITRTNTPLERCLKQYQYHVHAITQKYFDLVGAGRGWTAFQNLSVEAIGFAQNYPEVQLFIEQCATKIPRIG
jgi:hypothetical protein